MAVPEVLFHRAITTCRCLLFLTIIALTDVMGSVCTKCALLSKLEPYCAPDPEEDNRMKS
jgi:hypothetical protein